MPEILDRFDSVYETSSTSARCTVIIS